MTADSDDRWRTAVHEAGHAIIARKLGIPCGQASVVQDHDSRGHSIQADPWAVLYQWEHLGKFRELRSALVARALMLMAGAEAERLFLGGTSFGDSDDRIEIARALAEGEVFSSLYDAGERLRSFAYRLVSHHRLTIEAVARELMATEMLTGAELDALCYAKK